MNELLLRQLTSPALPPPRAPGLVGLVGLSVERVALELFF